MKATILMMGLLLAGHAMADDYAEAKNTVSQLVDRVLVLVQDDAYKEDEAKLIDRIGKDVLVFVDLETMSKLTLGPHWKTASHDQQQNFILGFRRMLLSSYVKSVLLLKDIKVQFVPPPESSPARKYQIVNTLISFSGDKAPLSVNYSLVSRDGNWRIFDLWIDGVSMLRQFRQNFDAEIKETGLARLIQRLQGL